MRQTDMPAWNDTLSDLWRRISQHDLEGGQPLGFTKKLARHLHWPLDFTRAAILEYRRFCFLACVSPTPVTPSEEVDEVWHMHLVHSRDYWDIWCGEVLGRKLHHEPSSGRPEEAGQFRAQYAQTLATYESFFGPPPAAFWPATYKRFGRRPRFSGFDAGDWFLIPNPTSLWRRIGGAIGAKRR
jgi:hypothetical protein